MRVLREPTPAPSPQGELPLRVRTVEETGRLPRLGGGAVPGAQRKLYELAATRQPEPIEVKPGHTLTAAGHELARAHVAVAMQLVYQLIGLRPEQHPEASMAKIIYRHVCRTYSHFAVEEVYEAFVHATAGEFPATLKVYGQVSLPFLNDVWKAYDTHAYRAPAPVRPHQAGANPALTNHLKERRAHDELVKDLLLDYLGLRLQGKTPVVLLQADRLYLALTTELGITPLSKDDYAKIYETATKRVAAELNVTINAEHRPRCLAEAYRITVGYMLTRMVEKGWTLERLREELAQVCFMLPGCYEYVEKLAHNQQWSAPRLRAEIEDVYQFHPALVGR